MSLISSLQVDAFGIAVVFMVLISLSMIIKLFSKLLSVFSSEKEADKTTKAEEATVNNTGETVARYAAGELKLIDVDEKTAALIMAIVSDESKIPLSELNFKSIRLVK